MKVKFLIFLTIFSMIGLGVNAQPAPSPNDPYFGSMAGPIPAGEGLFPYVNVRMWAGNQYKSKYFEGATESRTDFQLDNSPAGNNELGAMVKKGNFFAEGTVGYSSIVGVIIPRLYGTYTLDGFQLMVGINGSPYTANIPFMDTADVQGMCGQGGLFDRSPEQIMLLYKGFYVSFMSPSPGYEFEPYAPGGPFPARVIYSNSKFRAPKMAVGYSTPMPVMVGAHFVGQTFKIDNPNSGPADPREGKSVVSYAFTVKALAFMPFGIVMGNLYYGQNTNDMECLTDTNMAAQIDATDTTKITNTTGYGGNIGVSYRLGKFMPAAGGGYESFDNDNYSKRDSNAFLFASAAYTLAPGFNIIPSFKLKNLMKDGYGNKQGSEMWYGILFEVMSLNIK